MLRALRELKPSRLLVVFGCGGDRDRTQAARLMANRAVEENSPTLGFVTSDNPRTEDPLTHTDFLSDICTAAFSTTVEISVRF